MNAQTPAELLESIIRQRKTEKVLCELKDSVRLTEEVEQAHRQTVLKAIETSGWAPFHYARNVEGMAEPWRAHVLWQEDALRMAAYLADELNDETKVPKLAAACSALVIVTWLPEFYTDTEKNLSPKVREVRQVRDEEHLAAASAMVQNLLLMLTAHEMGSYWSSGGKLREREMFEYLGIPEGERFLAAVFIEYPEAMQGDKERKPGGQRENRSTAWIREAGK